MSMVVRNTVKKCYSNSRNFSRSCVRKETENKVPQSEAPKVDQSHLPPVNMRLVEPKDRYWLLYGSKNKYKTKEEIPKHVPISELAAAQTRVRIKVCNYMMIGFSLLFLGTALRAKFFGKEEESVMNKHIANFNKLQEEGARERAAKAAAAAAAQASSR